MTDAPLIHQPKLPLAEIATMRVVLEQTAIKWPVLVLTVLYAEPSRFNAIKRVLVQSLIKC